MPDLKNLKEYIRAMEHVTHFLRQLLDEEKRITPPPATEIERLSEFTDLRLMTKSDIWPDAIDPELIGGDSAEDKANRAEGILRDFVKIDLTGKRFLDYGCGDGFVAAAAAANHGTALSVGYDPVATGWESHPPMPHKLTLTTHLADNEFDVVLLHDVLDHASDPLELLQQAKLSKKLDGKIFVRCHPWASRHGTHLYRKLNKAYLQLVFTESELIAMGYKGEKVIRPLDPVSQYRRLFAEMDLQIVEESTISQPVDAFFTTRPAVVRRIKDNWKGSLDPELASGSKYPHEIMQIQFADFVLV